MLCVAADVQKKQDHLVIITVLESQYIKQELLQAHRHVCSLYVCVQALHVVLDSRHETLK